MGEIIFFDTETTGLLKPEAAQLAIQPNMTEISAIKCKKIDGDYEIVDEFNTLVKPPIPLPPEITKITGITDEMLENEPHFLDVYPDLARFFLGVDTMVAHNLSFDVSIIQHELERYDLLTRFPWPMNWRCTIDLSMPITGKRMKLGALYAMATGKEIKGAHRARNDVVAMIACYKFLEDNGFIDDKS